MTITNNLGCLALGEYFHDMTIRCNNAMQEHYGVTATALVDDPDGVTIERLASEIVASGRTRDEHVPSMTNTWISPSPVSIRLRLYCFPYAGGISEIVYARQALSLPTCLVPRPLNKAPTKFKA